MTVELSLVMSTGNNNYGSVAYRDVEPAVPTQEQDRMELCFYTLYEAFKNINYEIVLVEWLGDPEGNRITKNDFLKHPRVRIITVPYEFANRICPERPFHETHAKNIGIRRAEAPMILAMNNDCLWLDEVPRSILNINSVMVADRPTVYHTVLNCEKEISVLRDFCNDDENVVTKYDYNANGDFTLMPKELWYRLDGLSTPRGDAIAGVDMQMVARAERATGKTRYMYPYKIWHIRHPGRPLASSFNNVVTQHNWGFPNETFEEWGGEHENIYNYDH